MDVDFAISRPLVRPRLPRIRFLFVRSRLCSTLPPDPASRRRPCAFASTSPPSGCAEDFHLQAARHAWHTTNPPRGSQAHAERDRSVCIRLLADSLSLLVVLRRLFLHDRLDGPGRFCSWRSLTMTVLRQRMLDDMRIRNLAAETQTSYLRQVTKFARYYGQSPELLGPEDIQTYQLHLIDDRQLAPTSVAGTVAAPAFPLSGHAEAGLGGRSPPDAEARRDAAGRPEPRGSRSVSRRRGASQAPHDPHHVLRRWTATQRGAAAAGRRRRQ